MHIELICIGNELLEGFTVNTNATAVATILGHKLKRVTTIGDDPQEMCIALREALSRSDLVLTSGGLGPTVDDLTEEVLTNEFGKPKKQIENSVGSAPGLIFSAQGKQIVAMPGVPIELEEMLKSAVVPLVEKEKTPIEEIHFVLMSETKIDPSVREWQKENRQLEFGIYPNLGGVTLRIKGEGAAVLAEKVRAAYPGRFCEEASIAHALQVEMIKRKKRLVTAESCTGGAIASRLTKIPGASDYFEGGIVCYSNTFKENYLSVSPQTLASFGAVSREVVVEMAKGALRFADYSVAVSGIAGPLGGTEEKPVGTVWAAIGAPDGKVVSGLIPMGHKKTRKAIIEKTSAFMISALWLYVVRGEDVLSA
ncbi:MAG: nicotinamide-nucleotide amidohydrolase family protein [Candidatus Algichlamydia australiensis]|nr:nicotinamide-nucleotide amidohydrolase family protein [Chlamydiales bacterium]